MHEIITLQLGQRSNYLATHFWNTQESYFTYSADEESPINHDVHFRPGIGADGTETFTPRTLIYDLKGGFGSLRRINALYDLADDGSPQGLWNGPTVVQRQPLIPRNEYQESLEQGLEPPRLTTESVKYWSDYNRVYFHPKSIFQLNEYELNSSLQPFEKWDAGVDLFESLDKEHDLLDRDLRPFAEEADQMQGIQLMCSTDDAWGGFTSKYLERLRDEYGKNAMWLWGLEDNDRNVPRDKQFLRLSNTAKSISELSQHASLLIPFTLPKPAMLPAYVNLDRQSMWHVSALLSTALESVSLSSRLRSHTTRQSLDEAVAGLNVNGNQNIAKLQMSVKSTADSQTNGYHETKHDGIHDHRVAPWDHFASNGLDQEDGEAEDEIQALDIDFFPAENMNPSRRQRFSKQMHTFGRIETVRGNNSAESEFEDNTDGYERARRRAAGLPVLHKVRIPLQFPLLTSFPPIYPNSISDKHPDSIFVQSSLSTDSGVSLRIKGLRGIISRTVGLDEREALSNSLGEIAEAYEEGWDSGSDGDDDDD